MGVKVCRQFYTTQLVRSNPDKVFLFGDNLLRRGQAGQACIRFENNSFGIVTKRIPSMKEGSFFSDKEDELTTLDRDLEILIRLGERRTIVIPYTGIGTGLARLKQSSPIAWEHLCFVLKEYFNFDNDL